MVQLVIRTDKDIREMLEIAFRLAQSEDRWDVFYRTHPGFNGWVQGNNPYVLDADIVNLRMMEILEYMDCECYAEGGLPSEWDEEPNENDWKEFMLA